VGGALCGGVARGAWRCGASRGAAAAYGAWRRRAHLALEPIALDHEHAQALAPAELRRYAPAQLVLVEAHVHELGALRERAWDRPAQLVALEAHAAKLGAPTERGGDLAVKPVPVHAERAQRRARANLLRDPPLETIALEKHVGHIGEPANLSGHGAAEADVDEAEACQLRRSM